ncbi:hypothetical protein LEP1GSC203_3932 [Leptospira terpstrae serovar Hualin str. LT 11-33 = ATCC 700639]|uniref:Uncharacterized protein n=1 Tax=Leptospira terpstrae serovar Hualin str. LT 11-33 = ATCC 700639 TaxID=1257025 RepID=N1W2N6_9LEPT|nr:hypothetical protein LEP1GSC203_3932 [Leptospira terpstrae serovar Hualin str. LT 11-33 = ATCC 700639]
MIEGHLGFRVLLPNELETFELIAGWDWFTLFQNSVSKV